MFALPVLVFVLPFIVVFGVIFITATIDSVSGVFIIIIIIIIISIIIIMNGGGACGPASDEDRQGLIWCSLGWSDP